MNRVSRYTIILAVVGVSMLGLSACGYSSMPAMDHGSNPTVSAEAGANFNTADLEFAQMMIPHHRQAVEMADLAATRAADPEVKALATAIKAAQQPEIDTMTAWLTAWKQPTAAPGGGHNMPGMGSEPGMMSEQDMTAIKGLSGKDFDREFARMMIAHHHGAIQMAQDVQKNGSHPEVKRLAVTIEQAQTAEVAELQAILNRL